jgi:hypothetical protein
MKVTDSLIVRGAREVAGEQRQLGRPALEAEVERKRQWNAEDQQHQSTRRQHSEPCELPVEPALDAGRAEFRSVRGTHRGRSDGGGGSSH